MEAAWTHFWKLRNPDALGPYLIRCVINDPLAVACFADKDLCRGFTSYVQIETGGISIGQSVVDSMHFYRHSPNALVMTEVDTLAFFRLFFSSLLGVDKSELDLLPQLIRTDSRTIDD